MWGKVVITRSGEQPQATTAQGAETMNAQTTTATQAVEILEAEGFDAGDIEAVLSSFIDASTDLPWDDDEDEWLLSAADMQVVRDELNGVSS